MDLTLRAATAKGIGLLYSDGEVDAAHAVLVDAIESSCGQRHHDSAGMVAALHALSEVCIFGGRPELWVPYQQAVGVLGNVVPPLLQLIPRFCPDPGAATAVDLQELEQHVNRLQEGSAGHAHTVHVGVAANVVDRMSGCRPALRRVFADSKLVAGAIGCCGPASCSWSMLSTRDNGPKPRRWRSSASSSPRRKTGDCWPGPDAAYWRSSPPVGATGSSAGP